MVHLLRYLTLLSLIFLLVPQSGVQAQDSDPIVEEIFNALTPQERVGQYSSYLSTVVMSDLTLKQLSLFKNIGLAALFSRPAARIS